MGILLKLSLRNMKRRKTRYILTAFALVISVALFGGVLIVSDSFKVMMIDTIDQQLGTAEILFKPANSTDGWFNPNDVNNEIEGLSHVQSIAYRISGFDVQISTTDSGVIFVNSTSTGIYGIEIQDEDEKALGGQPYVFDSLNDGNTIEELLDYTHEVTEDRVIVISQSLKTQLGKDFKVNDTVWILPDNAHPLAFNTSDTGTWLNYTVVAIIRDTGEAQDFDASSSEDEGSNFGIGNLQGPGIFLNIDNARILSNSTEDHAGEYNLGVVGTDDIYVTASVTNNIQTILDDLDDEMDWKTHDLKTDSIEMISTTMSTLQTVFFIFGVIALILAIVLEINIFNIIRKEQEYETGMFQAIGASKSETFKMFLIQGLVMGVIGTTIGTIASYFISYAIFSVVIQSLQSIASTFGGLTISTFSIILLPETIILTFVVGLVSSIIASIYPSWKASRKPIIECLNPIEEKSKRFMKHYLRRIFLFVLGALLIFTGTYMIVTAPPSESADIISMGASDGIVVGMFAPILILFGIIWIMALSLKPFNKIIITLFKPYLRRTKLLTENNILRHRKRTALTFIMIALTTSFLIGMGTLMDSMSSGIDTTIDNFMGGDIRIFTFNTPQSLEAELANQPGVDEVMGVSQKNAQFLIDGDWVGHGYFDSNYSETINIKVIDTTKVKEQIGSTEIISPSGMTLDGLMDAIEVGNKIAIMKELADDYDVKVGDVIPVKVSVGITFANFSMLSTSDLTDIHDDTVTVNMKISAIIESMEGFSTSNLLLGRGGSQQKQYNAFISWTTYKDLASQNLPGGGTDLIFRNVPDTGNPFLDVDQPKWFNFSSIEAILNGINEVEYYTTRMDHYSRTSYENGTLLNYGVPSTVVGIHTNSSGKLKSDMYFGNNIINGTDQLMEELLNTSDNVCVVDERFIAGTSLQIGDNLTIFSNGYTLISVNADNSNTSVDPTSRNFTSSSGNASNLTSSDDSYLSHVSNQTSLAFNIITNLGSTDYNYKTSRVTIETKVNATVDNLQLQAFNLYSNSFDTLGDINNETQDTNIFTFNVDRSYINPLTANITLRVLGANSTYNGNYNLSIDYLNFEVFQSKENFTEGSSWERFEIVGILEVPPTYSNTERYNWKVGYERLYDVDDEFPIYISYEKARNIVYVDKSGSNYSNDMITSFLVHCAEPEDLINVNIEILLNLGPGWTSLDLSTFAYGMRMIVNDWYVWIESGTNDEVILDGLLTYIQDNGYLVIFSLTKTYMTSTFSTMINLIVFITNSLLIFCIMIAMIGLILHSMLTTMARRREIGMLRSIGLSKKGVIRSISGETYVLSVLGLFIGIIGGLIMGYLIVETMPSGGFLSVSFSIPWFTIISLITVVIITVILSSQFPARWAANLNIIDAVRTR